MGQPLSALMRKWAGETLSTVRREAGLRSGYRLRGNDRQEILAVRASSTALSEMRDHAAALAKCNIGIVDLARADAARAAPASTSAACLRAAAMSPPETCAAAAMRVVRRPAPPHIETLHFGEREDASAAQHAR